jgi:hypothetical protein
MTTVIDQPTPAPSRGNKPATVALVLGILGVFFCWVPIVGFFTASLALGVGIMGYRQARRGPDVGSGQAVAGIVLGAIGAFFGLLVTVGVFAIASHASHDGSPTMVPAVAPSTGHAAGAGQLHMVESFGDGSWLVGAEIPSGTYKSAGPTPSVIPVCMWQRLSGTGGTLNEIITSDVSQGPAVVTIEPTDKAVKFSGCKDFVKVG